ncbi:MAG: hypothetical protein HYX67_10165 [Candidatus Melainabacteria bacterium]|nr:hypothetical protein [Candidatus Melainabacteria bacterium]
MKWLLLLFLPVCLFAGEFDDHLKKGGGDAKYLQNPEDKKRMGFFSSLFEMTQKREKPMGAIPKTLHFIWLGTSPFPEASVKNLRGWIDRHPGWKVKFWTDVGQSAPDDRMEVRTLDAFPLQELKECYFHSDNFGERSEILRYTVLLSEGGVYVDHDVRCIKAIDTMQESHDFFCGLEPLDTTILSSTVNPSPHLIGASQGHPILFTAKKWLKSEWDRLETEYTGSEPADVYNRVQHRTFSALSVGVRQSHSRAGRKDVVCPPDYFSLASSRNAIYAVHSHAATWHKDQKERKREFYKTVIVLAGLSVACGVFWLVRQSKKRNSS